MPKEVDTRDFAERVERLCDFLLSKEHESTGSKNTNDAFIIHKLKEDAANLQFQEDSSLKGLQDYMEGLFSTSEEKQ